MKQSVFVIRNMDCPTEEALIRKRLGSVAGVAELAFNLMEGRLTVTHSLSDEQPILSALHDLGMEAAPAVPVRSQPCSGEVCPTVQGSAARCDDRSLRPAVIGSFFGGGPWRWFVLASGVALADQVAKQFIVASVPYGASKPVVPFFNVVHFLNEGAAFGLLAGAGGWQRYFFLATALVISAGLILLTIRGVENRREACGFNLVLGGAVGNMVDRGLHGAVVDYLDLHAGSWHWPAFNLADSAIVLGVLLLLWEAAASSRKEARECASGNSAGLALAKRRENEKDGRSCTF